MTTRHGSATVTLPSDTEILIVRHFEAPRDLVWEALTTPRHLLRWWGPDFCPLTACEVDLRVGGSWRYVCTSAGDGTELAWHGTYREIEAGRLIVSTEVFEGFPDAESLNTMTLTDAEGVTTLRTLVRHSSTEHRDGHVASGMESGMQLTFDRLDDLLAMSSTTSERLRRSAGRFADRTAEVAPQSWSNPAPCEGWTARDVVRHLVEWVPGIASVGGVDLSGGPSVDDDPVGAFAHLAAGLQGAVDDPAVGGREMQAGPAGTMTVEQMIDRLVVGDIVVHTWDLARATGLDPTIDRVIAAEMYEGMLPLDAMLRQSGHFGERVDVPDDADIVDKLLAFTGRDPAWMPG